MSKKIVLSTISLHHMAGGLEKNITRVANYFASSGHQVSLVTFDLTDAVAFFQLDPRVAWHCVGRTLPHTPVSFWQRLSLIYRMRSVIRGMGHDVQVIIFHHGIILRWFLATLGLRVRLICSERNSLSLYNHITRPKYNLNFMMLYLVDKIVVQFPQYRQDYPVRLRPKITCIPNAVDVASVLGQPAQAGPDNRLLLLAVGRLCDQKNYACLLIAFAKLVESFPQWDLVIIGVGELGPVLKQQAVDLGLASRVKFVGQVNDMPSWFACTHLYVMPSKWEGFPNALAEALAHGLPAVGFEKCAGVSNLIRPNENGLLAAGMGDAETLSAALATLMGAVRQRALMGRAAIESVTSYHARAILPLWDDLIA